MKNEWIYHPVVFSNEKKMNNPIFHWIPKTDKEKYFSYERFNISTELEKFSEEEYNKFLKVGLSFILEKDYYSLIILFKGNRFKLDL